MNVETDLESDRGNWIWMRSDQLNSSQWKYIKLKNLKAISLIELVSFLTLMEPKKFNGFSMWFMERIYYRCHRRSFPFICSCCCNRVIDFYMDFAVFLCCCCFCADNSQEGIDEMYNMWRDSALCGHLSVHTLCHVRNMCRHTERMSVLSPTYHTTQYHLYSCVTSQLARYVWFIVSRNMMGVDSGFFCCWNSLYLVL